VIADGDAGDLGTDGLDDARRLVTEHHRDRDRERTVDGAQVGVAQAAVADADLHFASTGAVEHDVVGDREWLVRLFEHGSAQERIPPMLKW
jgi:hypothetical protein